jgi:hypothetical protein
METPSFLSCELVKSATSGAFDGVVTPSGDSPDTGCSISEFNSVGLILSVSGGEAVCSMSGNS